MHDDHIGSITSLLEYCRYSNFARNITNVYVFDSINELMKCVPSAPYKSRFDTYLGIFGMSIEWLKKVTVINADEFHEITGLYASKYTASHSCMAYSYVIEDRENKELIYYSGDSNSHDNLITCISHPQYTKYSVDCYLECSSLSNGWAKTSTHFAEIRLPEFLNRLSDTAFMNNVKYNVHLMHIDSYNSYNEFSKKLIVETI